MGHGIPGIWDLGQEQDRSTQLFVPTASLCCKSRVANVRLKCIAVSEEILFIAVAPCRVEENIPCGQRNAGVALTAVGVGSQ